MSAARQHLLGGVQTWKLQSKLLLLRADIRRWAQPLQSCLLVILNSHEKLNIRVFWTSHIPWTSLFAFPCIALLIHVIQVVSYFRMSKSLKALKCENQANAFAAWCCEESLCGLDLTIKDKNIMEKEFGPFSKRAEKQVPIGSVY